MSSRYKRFWNEGAHHGRVSDVIREFRREIRGQHTGKALSRRASVTAGRAGALCKLLVPFSGDPRAGEVDYGPFFENLCRAQK